MGNDESRNFSRQDQTVKGRNKPESLKKKPLLFEPETFAKIL